MKKIREDNNKCGELCPLFYAISSINNFYKQDKKCPIDICKAISAVIDENGNIPCSKTGSLSNKLDGYWDKGNFVRYIAEKSPVVSEEKKSDKPEKKELVENIDSDEDSRIQIRLDVIEQSYVEKSKRTSYFFKQCADVQKRERCIYFYNTKNALLDGRRLEAVEDEEEREKIIMKGHEYKITFDKFLSMDIDDLTEKLNMFFESLYTSIQQGEKKVCDGCYWERQGAKSTAMDCINCARNERSKIKTDERTDNFR
jgi:hypothetical protein